MDDVRWEREYADECADAGETYEYEGAGGVFEYEGGAEVGKSWTHARKVYRCR
jgi:hypothetical protein